MDVIIKAKRFLPDAKCDPGITFSVDWEGHIWVGVKSRDYMVSFPSGVRQVITSEEWDYWFKEADDG